MVEAAAYEPTPEFNEAKAFLSTNSSKLPNISQETLLEIYGIFKFLTVSPEPTTPRPSIFSYRERAKYDAWKSAGTTWREKESEAETRYIDIARSLGWTPGSTIVEQPEPSEELTAEELLAQDSNDDPQSQSGGIGSGMGSVVSKMQRDEDEAEPSLHNLAIKGDVKELQAFLESHAGINVNSIDEYGFTALHLASDRGNADIVKLLLRKGADASLKDSDGLSALDLAQEANHQDIVVLLRNTS